MATTEIIRHLKGGDKIVVSAPRQSGKTTAACMAKYYLDTMEKHPTVLVSFNGNQASFEIRDFDELCSFLVPHFRVQLRPYIKDDRMAEFDEAVISLESEKSIEKMLNISYECTLKNPFLIIDEVQCIRGSEDKGRLVSAKYEFQLALKKWSIGGFVGIGPTALLRGLLESGIELPTRAGDPSPWDFQANPITLDHLRFTKETVTELISTWNEEYGVGIENMYIGEYSGLVFEKNLTDTLISQIKTSLIGCLVSNFSKIISKYLFNQTTKIIKIFDFFF